MEFTKIKDKIKRALKKINSKEPLLRSCVSAIGTSGGRVLLVGGAVRDLLLDKPLKDIDMQVHGITLDQLENILSQYGYVRIVGKSFGVLRLDGMNVDWSLPRQDSAGRKPAVKLNPFLSIKDAFVRRDLTINALGIDLVTGDLLDPFGGLKDLKQSVLRTPDPALFVQDPLRLFRVMQFISRFEMEPDDELSNVCAAMDISDVSAERIEQEFAKLLLLSQKPSLGLRWLHSIGRLKDVLPALARSSNIMQRTDYHPEGDVFEHAMQSVDAAARQEYADDEHKLILLWAAILHDIGKLETTRLVDGVLKSPGHAEAGAPIARKELRQLTRKKSLLDAVETLVYHHMHPLNLLRSNASDAAYKRLAHKLWPHATIAMLAQLFRADRQGRNKTKGFPLNTPEPEVDQFIARAKKLGVLHGPEQPIVKGADLKGLVQEGPLMGTVVKKAYTIQIEKGITDKQELVKRALQGIVE
jgi:tRNA nucleotidyltransferase (CCA-adding enzyme)